MMYQFMELEDGTQIVHSELLPDNTVKVYLERPDEEDCFHSATCYLPNYKWDNIDGFTDEEIQNYQEVLESVAHLIYKYAKAGGFDNA